MVLTFLIFNNLLHLYCLLAVKLVIDNLLINYLLSVLSRHASQIYYVHTTHVKAIMRTTTTTSNVCAVHLSFACSVSL